MAIYEAPWDYPGFESPAEFFATLCRHWPHYTTVTLQYSTSWSASRTIDFPDVIEYPDPEGDPDGQIEHAATSRTDSSTGSISGTLTWTRQAEADEISNQDLADGEFIMRLIYAGNASTAPRIDNAFLHAVGLALPDGDITGTWSETLHTGSAGDVITTTTSGDLEASPTISDLGILESGTAEWAKTVGTIGIEISGHAPPIPLPSLIGSLTDLLSGPPAGASVVFSDGGTLNTPDTGDWHGTASRSFTLTLST